jgi:adenine-specific DNA-methyltransferase
MIYPRLYLARTLLRDDGLIFTSIDDNEAHNLRLLMDEIFGEESFIASFVWHRRQNADSRNEIMASTDHEYVLCYGKALTKLTGKKIDKTKYKNPDKDLRGPWFSADLTGLAQKNRNVLTMPNTRCSCSSRASWKPT